MFANTKIALLFNTRLRETYNRNYKIFRMEAKVLWYLLKVVPKEKFITFEYVLKNEKNEFMSMDQLLNLKAWKRIIK